MPYIILATLLLVAAGGIFSLYRQLQVLQQNSYFPSRYFKLLKESYTLELAISAIAYCAISVCMVKGKDVAALVLAAFLFILRVALNVKTHKKSIKKLLFTTRVKRLYVAAILILGTCILVAAFTNGTAYDVSRTLCLVLAVVTPLLTFVVWLITYPIEKAIANRRANDAKKI